MTNYPILYFRNEVIKQVVIGEKEKLFSQPRIPRTGRNILVRIYTCAVDASRIVDAHVYTHLSVLMPPIIIIRSTNQPLRLVPIFFLILTRRFAKVQKPSRGERRVRERLFSPQSLSSWPPEGNSMFTHARRVYQTVKQIRVNWSVMFSSCGSIWNLMTIVNVGYEYIWIPFFVLLKLYERIEELSTNLVE